MNPTPEEVAAWMRSLGFELYKFGRPDVQGLWSMRNYLDLPVMHYIGHTEAAFFYQQAHPDSDSNVTIKPAPPTGDMGELREIISSAVALGRKLEAKKGLTSNQGGIPHPEFYEKKHIDLYEKKVLALKSEWERAAILRGAIGALEHVNGLPECFVERNGMIVHMPIDKRLGELRVELAELQPPQKEAKA